MLKYPIDFYDKNSALRTGIIDSESEEKDGVWVMYQGSRIFVQNENIRKEENIVSTP